MEVLLVDDHVLIRDALRGVLRELTDDAIVLEASDSRPLRKSRGTTQACAYCRVEPREAE